MAESDLSLSDALSDCLDRPAQEALVHRDFVAQLEAEAFDDQIGETVGKTDYVPLLDGDGTATDVGPALENGQKKAEGVQKPGSKVNAVMQPGRPEPHGEVCPWADPPDLGSDLLVPASMAHPAGLLGSPTSPAQVEDSSPMGAFADLMDLSVAPAPAGSPPSMAGPQQHSPMLPEPQAPRGAPHPAPGSSPGDRWPPADLPFTPSVSTVISRHAGSLAGSPDRPAPEGRAPRESAAYAGGDEKEGDGPDRSKQRRKKKRRQKDEGSWEQPEAQEPPDEGPAPADALYQRVGPHRDRAAGAGAWEEQIGRSGGRAKKGKSRKKLPEEWAATGRPSVPAATQAELGGAVPGPEEPSQGAALGSSGRESYPEDAGLDPDPLDPLDPLDRDLLACPAPPPARSGGLKATAPPFTMPAGVLLGSSPLSSGPAHSLLGDAVDGALLIDTSAFSPASQPSPLLHASFSASDSSWLAGDSLLSAAAAAGDSSFDLGDLLPPGVGLDPSGPAPLRSPRTTAPDSHAREPASSSTSSPPSPPSAAAPSSPPPPGSHLNPAAKPFFPSLAEPLEGPPPAAPGSALVIEDTQTPGRYVGEDAKDDEMEDQMERLDEYIQLDHGERRREQAEEAGKVENRDEDTLTKQHAANNEMDHGTEAAEEETQEKQTEETAAVCEKMEERVEATPDKPQLGGTRAKGVEEAEHSADGHAEQTIQVSGADQHQETLILERSKPCEKVRTVTVTAATDKTETGDAKATVSQEDCTPQDGQTPNLLDRGFEAPEKEESKMDATKLLESKMDAPKVQESKMDAPKVQESKMDAPKVQESKMDAPKVQESKMDAPKVQESKMDAPKVQESKMDAPKVQESKMDAPKVHESKEEATKVHESKEEATKVQESMVRVTLTEDPKMEVPSMEATKVEKSKVEVTFVEDRKLEGSEAQESTADGVEKSAEEEEVEEVTAEPHEKVEREHREEEKPAGPAVETKDDVAEEGGKTAEKKHKSGKLESPTKKPAAKPSAGGPAPGKEPSSPDKKTKPATTATKLTAATKARPGSAAAAAPTRRPAPAAAPASTSTSMSSTLAKKTPAARPAGAPAASPKRAPAGAGTALRDAKPKTTSTTATATERRVPGSKVTTAPTARSAAGPAPSRNVPTATSRPATAATRATAAPRPALGSASAKPPASKPDSKLGAERKLGPLKTSSADPSKPRTGLGAAARPKSAPLASSAGPAAEKKTLVSRVRPATTSSTSTSTSTSATTRTSTLTSRTSTSTSRTATTSTTRPSTSTTRPSTSTTRPSTSTTRPTARPGSASNPDTKNVRSKTASTDRMKPQTGVKVSSVSQNKMAASKEPNPGKAHIDSVKPDYSHVTSRLGSKDNMKHVPGGGNVQILNKKVDLGKVTSKCGSKDNIKHKPGGGAAKVESNKVNLKEKAPSKVGSVDNLVGPPEKEEGNTAPPAVSGEQGPPEAPPAPPAQENGLKEGGPCGSEGLCDARIPETN